MIWLYRLLFPPAFVILLPAYLRRMLRRGGYRRNFSQRFGAVPPLPPKAGLRVWLQAVSVGEMLAVGPLLEALRRKGFEVYLTTTTSTGYALASSRYRDRTVGVGYFPIDGWPFSRRAWNAVRPDVAVLMEGERWPEHAAQARARRVPVLCINARMSDRSFGRLRRFPAAARMTLGGIDRVVAASREDAARFRKLGVPAERITVSGNLKLELSIPLLSSADRERLRGELGLGNGRWIVGASTWPGEEAALVAAFAAARAAGEACSLLLVPRHAERRAELEAELGRLPWRVHFRSRGPATGPVDIAVGDTTGELRNLLQLADLVFVGKSLPPHTEGQTPVEAAALGKPILFGPGMANFRPIARDLLARGAAREVAGPDALTREILALIRTPEVSAKLGAAALAWREENRGALDRTLEAISAASGA